MRHKAQQRQGRLLRSLVALVLAAGGTRELAHADGWGLEREDPLWTIYTPQLRYIQTDVDAQQSSYHSATSGNQDTSRMSVVPAIGIGWQNFIYHPYLLTYTLLLEPGYHWTQSSVYGSSYQTEEWMLNGRGQFDILAAKPYAATVTFDRSHQDVQSDFFTSETSDTQNYSLLTGYRTGAVPVTLTFEQSQDDRNGFNQEFLTEQTKLGLHAVNEREKRDTTAFDYQYNQFNYDTRSGAANYSSESSSHQLIMTDVEHFRQSALSSSLYFTEREWQGYGSSDLTAALNYNIEHTPHLTSFYNYAFADSFGSGYNSYRNNVAVGLNHQLYESLASHVDAHGSDGSSDSGGSSQDTITYGVAGSVNYSKRLGGWAHLSVGNGVTYDSTVQQSTGTQLVIPDESHALPLVGPLIIHLNTPRAISITSVMKNNTPLDSTEWTVNTTTDPWMIQFFSGGLHSVSNGDTITVTYVVESNPSGSYSTLTYAGQVELRFWNDQAGLHAGYNQTRSQADTSGFTLEDLKEYQVGADLGWHGLHADASYSDQQSTYYSYQNLTLNEGYAMPIFSRSSIGISLSQQWSVFPPGSGATTNQTQNLAFYSYMLNYGWHSSGSLGLRAELGLQQQRGSINSQDLIAGRIYLNWNIGKIEMNFGYEHENQEYRVEKRERDYMFLRMRRNF